MNKICSKAAECLNVGCPHIGPHIRTASCVSGNCKIINCDVECLQVTKILRRGFNICAQR